VEQAEVCVATGLPPCPDCAETRTEWFSAGAVPAPACGVLPEAAAAVKGGWEKIGQLFGLNQ
jgi:hypothetical protein